MQVPHKGIGSGIVRILVEYPEIRLENDVNGKEFKVAIPRTILNGSLKYRNTTQKNSLKDSNTILKTDVATQKDSLKDSYYPKGIRAYTGRSSKIHNGSSASNQRGNLQFVASVLPGVFSEGTKYACNEE